MGDVRKYEDLVLIPERQALFQSFVLDTQPVLDVMVRVESVDTTMHTLIVQESDTGQIDSWRVWQYATFTQSCELGIPVDSTARFLRFDVRKNLGYPVRLTIVHTQHPQDDNRDYGFEVLCSSI